jgi:hypothetical protein
VGFFAGLTTAVGARRAYFSQFSLWGVDMMLAFYNKGIEYRCMSVHDDFGMRFEFEEYVDNVCLIVDVKDRHFNVIRR